MKTVREEFVTASAISPEGPTAGILDEVDCHVWKKFDELKRAGKLKLWGVVDASGVVEAFLKKAFGNRPEGCVG